MSSTHINNKANANTNTNASNYLEAKNHKHNMVYAGISQTHCVRTHLNSCDDKTCGYWEKSYTEINVAYCNLIETKYSTRVTCYKCTECGRKCQD